MTPQPISNESVSSRNSMGEVILRHCKRRGLFEVEERDSKGLVWVREVTAKGQHGRGRVAVLPEYANDWRFDGEAPAQTLTGETLPYEAFYHELVDGLHPVLPVNLTLSDSGICLAGRVMGEAASRLTMEAVRFRVGEEEADLCHLLTVHSWTPDTVSRVTFFNSRTGQLERATAPPRLVVADGDAAFLKATTSSEFRESDVVGVVHRVAERERLEALGLRLSELTQWYGPDGERVDACPPPPRAVAVTVLSRR